MKLKRQLLAAGVVTMVLAMGVGCAASPPPTPEGMRLQATTIHNLDQNEYTSFLGSLLGDFSCPRYILTNIVGINCYDEPYLVQIAFRVAIGQPNSAITWLAHNYQPVLNGNFFGQGIACEFTDGRQQTYVGIWPLGFYVNGPTGPTSCPVPAGMGVVDFTGGRAVTPVDLPDIIAGNPLEVAGTIQLTFEADSLLPLGGPVVMAEAISGILRSALNKYAAALQLPRNAGDLQAFIVSELNNIAKVIGGFVLDALGGLGNGDDLLSITPMIFVVAEGDLANLVRGVLGLIDIDALLNGRIAGIGLRVKLGVLEPQSFTIQHDAQTSLLNLTGALGLDSPTTRYRTAHVVSRR